ncbi:MAG: type I polyketide synthase, partial [Vicinamibacterales bacterium]
MEQARSEPIAIVGFAARLPGAPDTDAFWDLLEQGRDAVSGIPPARWDADAFYDPDPDTAGKMSTRRAGFLDDAASFDAQFFGISPREAVYMDPQHRLLLETAWQALEHACLSPAALAGTRSGVFMGLSTHDYLGLLSKELDYRSIEAYFGTGTSPAAGVGRISYRLGFEGPAVTIDTACSSSLVAVHLASQSLRAGECGLALAGGVNVILTPGTMINFSRARMLAPDGRCKTFDASADGYVRGEGCGVIVLKRLSDAQRDGDRIRAVIRGSAVNQDGASGGLTVPNGRAQQRVIADALAQAGIAPASVSYLEAHGTGTPLGDPIEVQAAAAVLGVGRSADLPLLIGSVKTNIGHLEAAAGIAGVIKVVLALEHDRLPQHVHFTTPSPHIPWAQLPVQVVREARPWPTAGAPRIAGVSSFGFSGTNAHVLIAEAPARVARATPAPGSQPEGVAPRYHVLPLSARTPEALRAVVTSYDAWLAAHPGSAIADVCHTAGVGRSHLEHRAALLVDTTERTRELLAALADERPVSGVFTAVSAVPPKTAWLFTGQGSQYVGMGRELYDTHPTFRATLDHCQAVLRDRLERPLLDVMFSDGARLGHTSYAQPALFALEMSLARLWQSWGLEPDVVVGHSVGQYAAACVAGVFSLEDGLLLLAERGRLFGELPAGGSMAAIFADGARVDDWVSQEPRVSVAAYNGAHTVVSGPQDAIAALLARTGALGIRGERLDTSHAFHSALLDPALEPFELAARRVAFQPVQRTLICNRTGKVLSGQTVLDAAYWRRQARQPVQFAESVQTLAQLGCKVLLEIGPQPTLSATTLRAWPDGREAPRATASLRREVPESRQIVEALAQLYVAGSRVDFAAVARPWPRQTLDLPTYPFQRRHFWFTAKTAAVSAAAAYAPSDVVRLLDEGRIEELLTRLNGGEDAEASRRVLTQLATHHQRERQARELSGQLYDVRWRQTPVPSGRESFVAGETWLLIVNDSQPVSPLVGLLAAHQQDCRVLALSGHRADDSLVALKELLRRDSPSRIVHLASLDLPDEVSAASIETLQRRVLGGVLTIIQAAVEVGVRAPIWFVTRGAQPVVAADRPSPLQSAVWGFGRVVALEHPELWGGLADLPNDEAETWLRLLSVVRAGGEDHIAIRGADAYVARLERRTSPPAASPLPVRSEATYLITGGLGALGLDAAEHLAGRGARHIVLTSRRTPAAATLARIGTLRERYGCECHVVSADVGEERDLERVVTFIKASLPALAGILHAAGEIGSSPLATLDEAEIDRVFRGKVKGAAHLSALAAHEHLDFFVSFSSIASVWGSFGQAAYGAANAFLDGLAASQRGAGLPGTSVNFGPWSSGMADAAAREQLAKRGVQPLSTELAFAGLAAIAAGPAASGIVARVDWAAFLPVYQLQRQRSLMAELEREYPPAVAPPIAAERTSLVERLLLAPAEQRSRLMQDYLRGAVAETMRMDPAQIREDAGFFDLGMDSLMAIELRQRLQKELGRPLPATIALDHPRLTDAAAYLLTEVLGLQEQPRVEAAVARTTSLGSPIAIIGLACHFPGAPNPEAFWDLLANGVDAIGEVPADRFDIDEYYDPDPDTPGKIYTRCGGFLDHVDLFDPEFFGISPRETLWIEPQQRLMLETAWEALERAGCAPASLGRTRTGVYVGVGANEYSHLFAGGNPDAIDAYFVTGNALNVIAGRVAFSLGLEGPALTIDTACSSSLVAIHQACQALRADECDMALAGGVNVLISPATTIATSRARMLAPDGRCKTFDASADGYVRGEGCGVIVLKRLSDAERDGDRIRAVIRGSAVNQDGASGGLTVPNGRAQQRVIADALAQAGLDPGTISYLEAHGTGTSLGDPIEVQAAAAVLGAGRSPEQPLLIGSVKTNIGHLEAASGIAGVIKVVLALEHDRLPQHLHFRTPSPHIPWAQLPVQVVHEARPWPVAGRRTAGVSSFGFSGTNAHVVLEGPPAHLEPSEEPEPRVDALAPARTHHLLPVSARTPEALHALVERYHEWLGARPGLDVADVCFTAAVGRSHLDTRAALVVDSAERARAGLRAILDDRPWPGVFRGAAADPPKTAWLFTGQGSQYPGMGRELFATQPVFRETLTYCAEVLRDVLAEPLLTVMFDEQTPLGHTSYAQPALFALEMGLARLWQSWGLEPDVVLGHSVGQYAAACVAGVFSLEDGLRLLAERGRLFGGLPAGGRMAALFADAGAIDERLIDYPSLSVAAYNGSHTVVSGPEADVQALVAAFQAERVRAELLDTSHAFHSALLDPALEPFEQAARLVTFQSPQRTLICNRTGRVLTGQAVLDAAYWRRHARQPVQFAESVQTLGHLGCKVLLEIGPQPVLSATALRAWPDGREPPRAIASLRREVPDGRQITDAVAQLYVAGSRLDFQAFDRPWIRHKVDLPTYPFEKRRFWPKSDGRRGDDPNARGLAGSRRDLASGDVIFTSRFGVVQHPWLQDHVIYGTVVVPGATYAAMALQAVGLPAELQEVFFYEPMIFSDRESRDVQLTLRTAEDGAPGTRTFEVHSRPCDDRDAAWSLNASGTLLTEQSDVECPEAAEALEAILERLSPVRPQQLFDAFAENDLKWGPAWSSSLRALWTGEREAIGAITIGEALATHVGDEPVHPVLLDLCTGIAGASLLAAAREPNEETSLFLPVKYERVTLRESAPREFYCYARWQDGGRGAAESQAETQAFDLDFLSSDGVRLGGIKNFVVKRAPRQALLRGLGGDATRLLYRVLWRELPAAAAPETEPTPGTWLVAGFTDDAARVLRDQLQVHRQRVVQVDGIEDVAHPARAEHWASLLSQVSDPGEALAGIAYHVPRVLASDGADAIVRPLETGVRDLLAALHTLLGRGQAPLPRGLWIVSERAIAAEPSEPVDPVQAAFWGFGRTIIAEQPTIRCTLVDHDASPDALRALGDLLVHGAGEPERALRLRKCLVPRLMPWARGGQLAVPASPDYCLEPAERGAIEQLRLTAVEVPPPTPGYVQVRVQAAGLNFRDVLNALGLYPGDPGPIGGELAGEVVAIGPGVDEFHLGQRVFGFSPGAFATRVNVPFLFLAPQPAALGAVEAATTPAAMLTAGLAFERARLQRGERVLIHAATGGVGLAAVQLARRCGAIVVATASRPKQAMLRALGVEHIYDSRSTAFADEILADTGGAGVDVVLNSLTNEGFVEATVRVTARGGRFVEIAKRDIWSTERMAEARPDIDYAILALDEIMQNDPVRIKHLLTELADDLDTGAITPLPYQVYPVTEAKAAFRCMQNARHLGKIVLRMPEGLRPRADRTYLVTGGLGALGLRTAAYLAQLGAGQLVLTGRRAPDEAQAQAVAAIAGQFGCRVAVVAADVSRGEEVAALLARIRQDMPPLAGIAHLAGVLDDGLIPQQSWERFETTLAPKALGAWHLHRATSAEDLDFFLLYSSASSVLGSPGQANYATANALLDGLAAHRLAQGRRATSINWGPWAQAGMAAGEVSRAHLAKQGLIPLEPAAALAALSEILSHGTGQTTAIKANWARTAKLLGSMRPPMLEHVLPRAAAAVAGDNALLRQLHQVPVPQRGSFITEHLQRELQHILGLAHPPAPDSRFLELGMDSLMAVELRNRLLGQFGSMFTISSTVVFDYPNIRALA